MTASPGYGLSARSKIRLLRRSLRSISQSGCGGEGQKMQILKTKPYSSPLRTLDVPSSPRPPWWQSVPGQVALSAGAFLLVLFARRPETFLNPQLWAEDGPIFFVQSAYVGISLLVLLAVVLALFSPRLDLPARPACALAIVLIPHTGEAIGN